MNRRPARPADRLVAVVRLHLLVPSRYLVLPWGIMLAALALSVALFASFQDSPEVVIVGGLFSLYITLYTVAIQAVTKGLSFALALGLTRRAYYAGTCLFLALQAVASGVVLALLRAAEQGTDGWGTRLRFFDLPLLVGGGPVAAATGYSASLLLTCALGLASGAVARRWGVVGTSTLSALGVLVPGLAVWWFAQDGRFDALRRWVSGQPELALQAFWPAVVAVVVLALTWQALRRAPA